MFYIGQEVEIVANLLNDDEDDGLVGHIGTIIKHDKCDHMDDLEWQIKTQMGQIVWCSSGEIESFSE